MVNFIINKKLYSFIKFILLFITFILFVFCISCNNKKNLPDETLSPDITATSINVTPTVSETTYLPDLTNTPEPTPTASQNEDVITISDILINEVMVLNDWYLKQADGNYYDWVEFKNISQNNVNLSKYIITDKKGKMKHTLPDVELKPGDLYVVICSEENTGFALNSTSDNLYLYTTNKVLIDSVHLENIPYGSSYGRMDTEEDFYFFTKPTPWSNNASGVKEIAAEAISNYASGVYNLDSLTIELSSTGTVYFTLDGTEPTKNSQVYTAPITINKNTIIRTLVIEEGKLTGNITTFSYILNPDTTLPVLSLVTAPDNLWDDEIGIYVKGNHENYFQNWERAASFSYFSEDGSFNINCGLKLNGEGSRESDEKKSFKILFRGKYGASTLKYNFFNEGIKEYDSLVIRAGEDYRYSVFKNEMVLAYAKKYFPALIVQSGKYCSLYVNGEYFGIYCLMERVTEKYISERFNVPENEVIIENFAPAEGGELESIMNFCRSNDMSVKSNYDYIISKIDIESMTDWYILEAFTGNNDVIQNIRYVKLGNDGKWKWVAYDFDWSFYSHTMPFENVLVKGLWYTSYIIKPMLKNSEYKQYFIERFAYHVKNTFNDSTKVTNIIDELYAIIEPEIAKERALWGGSVESWNQHVNKLKSFVVDYNRTQELIDSFVSVFSLSEEDINKYFN